MFTPTCTWLLLLGVSATALPFIAAQTSIKTNTTLPTTTQKVQADMVEGIDFLISNVSASYKSLNNGFIRIPDIKKFLSPDIKDGIFGNLTRLQRVSSDKLLVCESPEQENFKTVSFQVTLPEAIVRYNKIQVGLGILVPTRQLTCLLKNLIYNAELSINFTTNACVANLSKFEVNRRGDSNCKLTGGYISFIDDFLSGFVNEWNDKLINTVKDNISNEMKSNLKTHFDCEKYRTTK